MKPSALFSTPIRFATQNSILFTQRFEDVNHPVELFSKGDLVRETRLLLILLVGIIIKPFSQDRQHTVVRGRF